MRVSARSEFARHFGQGPLSLSEVAQSQGISQAYLEQIAIDLRRAGLLESRRGAQGGYYLAQAPEGTTAGDVIRALEGSILPVRCIAGESCTPCSREEDCSARGVWEQVRDRLVETLDAISLADLE
jgi:Rrf2 family cysteine metabolism transcriptional repressor